MTEQKLDRTLKAMVKRLVQRFNPNLIIHAAHGAVGQLVRDALAKNIPARYSRREL